MASFILGTRQGETSTATYTHADFLMIDYLMGRAVQYLGTKTAESTMEQAFSGVERAAGLKFVFGSGNSSTVANRIGTHIWPETSVRQEFYNSAVAGNADVNKIYAKFASGVYKNPKIKITFKEVYNLNTKATVLTVIDSAQVV